MRDRRVRLVALGLVAVFILSYLIYQVVLISKSGIETQIAINETVYKTINTKCFVVRDEEYIVNTAKGTTISFAGNAERVAKGDTISMIFKTNEDANTYFAQGGIASVTNKLVDNFDKHIEDTMIAGDWLSDRAAVEKVVKEEVAKDEVSVIITKSPCVLIKGLTFPTKCKEVPEKCVKCGACLRPGCPALTKNADGTISIDQTMCNGCGLCKGICKFDAIETVEV